MSFWHKLYIKLLYLVYLLFDDAGFKKIKEGMARGEFSTSGSVKSWSKTPANAKDGSESW
jgi:hypothetical protein